MLNILKIRTFLSFPKNILNKAGLFKIKDIAGAGFLKMQYLLGDSLGEKIYNAVTLKEDRQLELFKKI